jgi:hypothetical protein
VRVIIMCIVMLLYILCAPVLLLGIDRQWV